MSRLKESALFFAVSLVLCWFVFGDAMLGKRLMAPVDIAPTNWEQYRFVDPGTDGIPQNHNLIDQLTYDLPIQWTVYHAYRRGEIPWWNPYSFGGRPLLADAHASAADPVRIACFLALPRFELAYNWVLIAHFLIGGMGIFHLLRLFAVRSWIAGLIGLAGMFAGYCSALIPYPWIQGSFIYYPWLWMARHRLWTQPGGRHAFTACVATTVILYAGNLQSHSYLGLFGAAFGAAYAGTSWAQWRKALCIIVPTGVIAGLLAMPVLCAELELLMLNTRSLSTQFFEAKPWDCLAAGTSFWPWALGSFRTFNYKSYSLYPFIGTAAMVLAFMAARKPAPAEAAPPDTQAMRCARRCAIFLVVGYLVIISVPPLTKIFYFRVVGLMVLGLLLLAGLGAEAAARHTEPRKKLARALGGIAVLIAAGTALMVFAVYPRVKPRLAAIMESKTGQDFEIGSKELRRAQVERYPAEVGFSNPEVLASWLGLVALAMALHWPGRRKAALLCALCLNLGGPVLHARRHIAKVPLEMWQRLLAGGPAQQKILAKLNPAFLRMADERDLRRGPFYAEFGQLHGVHTQHGYAALVPKTFQNSGGDRWQDAADYCWDGRDLHQSERRPPARLQWIGEGERKVAITRETLNAMDVEIGDGPAGILRRTDTYYPGWIALGEDGSGYPGYRTDNGLFTEIRLPEGPMKLRFEYAPSWIGWSLQAIGLGAFCLMCWAILAARRGRIAQEG